MAANTLCSVADRAAKIVGPIIGGLAVLGGFEPAFLAFGTAILFAALPVSRLRIAAQPKTDRQRFIASPMEFVAMLRGDRILTGLLIAAVTYMVMLGGLRPFLFWANRDWYGASDTAWTGLLSAQGVGALIGALAAGMLGRRLQRWMSAYGLTLVTGILEGVLHLALLLTVSGTQAMIVLAAASVPEILSTATWFTAMQERLTPQQQGIFFTFAMPVWDCAYALGVMSAGLHANGSLGLGPFWALVSLSATVPLLPLLAMHGWKTAHRGDERPAP